jgi:fumarate reductase flavoprotein subunit
MLQVAEAMAHSALNRRESRGSHQRADYPRRDDTQFLKHSMAYYQGIGAPRIDYQDVVITKWPPAERVYGAQTLETQT